MNHPDPKKHKQISFTKSALRIVGFIALPWSLMLAATFLIFAEVAGIWEETV
jgi:hypothetical protein